MIDRQLRIVFMGTPAFAVPSLEFLLDAGYPVVGVVTAEDKPGGRGRKQLISSPVKQFALERGLHVIQPGNLKSGKFLEELKSLKADLQVVVAFRMLPESVWNMPPLGTMNLHGSLLPAYRGAAPIQWAIIRGEKMTGVTTFFLRHEIDAGQILLQREIPILHQDDAGTLHDRMMHIGAGLVTASVDLICSGQYELIPQDDTQISHAPKIHHQDAHIHWSEPVQRIYNLIRGMAPVPGAWSKLDGFELKIWKSKVYSESRQNKPGTLRLEGKQLVTQALDGELEILEIQMEGKRRMNARDFINGYGIRDWLLT